MKNTAVLRIFMSLKKRVVEDVIPSVFSLNSSLIISAVDALAMLDGFLLSLYRPQPSRPPRNDLRKATLQFGMSLSLPRLKPLLSNPFFPPPRKPRAVVQGMAQPILLHKPLRLLLPFILL